MKAKIRIATRQSKLALWQANFVARALKLHHPQLHVELIGIKTQGDRILDISLTKVGGKGLFVKELEEKLLDKSCDFAVHSLKDVPYELPNKLVLGAYLTREDVRDVLVSPHFASIENLPQGARVGTSSLRRQAQLLRARPDLECLVLRGNVPTRVEKCERGEYDAIILAAAGLIRLGLEDKIRQYFEVDTFMPAIGQGMLAVECHADAHEMHEMLLKINDPQAHFCALAERSMNRALQGGCQVPIGGYAEIMGNQLQLRGRVLTPDGKKQLDAKAVGPIDQANQIGIDVAEKLADLGAKEIIKKASCH